MLAPRRCTRIETTNSTILISIRQFAPTDSKRVGEIEEALIRYLTPISRLSRFYEISPEGFLVAEIEGETVGYVIGNMVDGSEGHILAVAVAPEHRRRGVGTALLNAMIAALKDNGAKRVRLELKLSNINARRFYSSLGFKEHRVIEGYYKMRGYTEDAMIMFKDIP